MYCSYSSDLNLLLSLLAKEFLNIWRSLAKKVYCVTRSVRLGIVRLQDEPFDRDFEFGGQQLLSAVIMLIWTYLRQNQTDVDRA